MVGIEIALADDDRDPRDLARRGAEDLAIDRGRSVRQPQHSGRDDRRRAHRHHARADVLAPVAAFALCPAEENLAVHAGDCHRRDRIDRYSLLGAFLRQRPGQSGNPELGRAVVDDLRIAREPRVRGGVDDPAKSLRLEMRPHRARDEERPVERDVDHPPPLRIAERLERREVDHPGIVDQHGDFPEPGDRGGDDGGGTFAGRDRVGVGDGAPARGDDLGDDRFGGRGAVLLDDVIDQHRRAALGEQQGMLAPEPAPGAGDDHDIVVEAERVHTLSPEGCEVHASATCSARNWRWRILPTPRRRSARSCPAEATRARTGGRRGWLSLEPIE